MKALLAIAAIILAAASFAGCSSGDDTGSTTGADNTTSQSTTDGANSEVQGPRNINEIKAIGCSLYKQAAEEKLSSTQSTLESQVREFLTTEYPPNELEQVTSDWTAQIERLRAGTGGYTLDRAIKEVC